MSKLRNGRGWLLRDGERIARLEVAATPERRNRGLLGRDGIDGALLISPCNGVHTFRMRFPIDVAFLDRSWQVLDVVQMRRNRMGRWRLRAKHVLEAEWGALEGWGVRPGSRLDMTYDERRPKREG